MEHAVNALLKDYTILDSVFHQLAHGKCWMVSKQIREQKSFRVVENNVDLLIKVRQMLLDNRNKRLNLLLVFTKVS
jgi:hypothetical protein